MKKTDRLPKRNEIEKKDRWDIEAMYSDESLLEEDLKEVVKKSEEYAAKFRTHLMDDENTLLEALKEKDEIFIKAEKIYVYARMRLDEDTNVSRYQDMSDRATEMLSKISADFAFFSPELLSYPEEKIMGFLDNSEELEVYRHSLAELLRYKKHILSEDEEALLAKVSQLFGASKNIFSMINNADMKFKKVKDSENNLHLVSHGRYVKLMESKDRTLRRRAFNSMYKSYEAQKNTIASTYNYNTKKDVILSKIKGYDSSLNRALFADDVDIKVYDNLISVVNEFLPDLHRYLEIKRKALGVSKLHMYDLYVPIVDIDEKNISYEEAQEIVIEGMKPLGKEYQNILKKGFSERWVDVYENEGKRSGAYSFGSYDSYPYVLLNYTGKLKDVFTIAHEMGHSVNSYLTRENQPYVYGGHSIFTAEVASTVNENLLLRHLISKGENKSYLINLFIEEFRQTVFRQTMFAEFEKWAHKTVEEGNSLTPDLMEDYYYELNKKYFGKRVFVDDPISMEWARIPHFYSAFYVYKYATGFSAATALADNILTGEEKKINDYIDFLKAGESKSPVELLKNAGVDMTEPLSIRKALEVFVGLIDELEQIL